MRAIKAAATTGCIMFVFEAAKQALYPTTPIWTSHTITIVFTMFAAAVVTFAVLRRKAESEMRYRILFDSNPIPMWVFDRKTLKFLAVNEAASRQYGFSSREFLTMTIADIRPEEDIPDLLEATRNPVQGLQEPTIWRHQKKNGAIIDVEIIGHDLHFHGVEAELIAARDVTERKNAEETVQRLASIVEFSEDAIIGTNLAGMITSWNRAAEKMYGYTTAEAVHQNLSLLVPSERQAEMRALMERVQNGLPIECLETQRLTKAGSVLEMSVSISPIRDAAGRITGASTIARDITLRKRAEERSTLQSAALEAAANAIVITDHEGTIVWSNRAFTTMTGYSAEEVLGKNAGVLKSGEQSESYYAKLWSTISSGKVWQGEIVNRRKDGTTYTEEMTITPMVRDARNPANRYYIAIKQDITERKQAEEALLFKTALLEAQAETTIDGILAVDESNHIVLANKQFGLHFEIPDELLSTRDDLIVLKHVMARIEAPDAFIERVKYLYSHRNEKSRDEFSLKNGKVFDRYSAPLVDSKSRHRGRIWYFRDITDRKLAEERAEFLAYYDALTGLPNRTLLEDRLSKALAGARRRKDRVAFLFLDLDRFKNINDSLGHSVGDLVLKEVAERLKRWAREQDTVARLSGDEFLIMVTSVKDITDAAVAAERLMNAVAAKFVVQGHSLSIPCSLGISIFPEHGADGETLIKNAEAAMYSAKDNGRHNFQFFTQDMNAQVVERLSLENGLRMALERNELFLVYQPQMEIATGRITGLEALLRWQHPELGLVPPDRFIRIAENSGQIVPIGEWVLRTACSQARKWQDKGLPAVSVAVNVSAVQFRREGFCELVRRILHDTGLDPHYLELELTESLLLANAEVTVSVIQQLKSMGVTLAIDDFGTGYSNFSYMRQFQVSKLKIDRSFIRDVAANPNDAAITAAIIGMAKGLSLKVIAEGVENEEQMSFLRTHRCNEIQGYYFSKPLTVDKVADKLRGGDPERLALAHASGK
ncbi:MAG: EAL domain-containing protein [Acidobacteriia bacterium]|nr:EAL domain-containing protein [Terriglobia bacterium]